MKFFILLNLYKKFDQNERYKNVPSLKINSYYEKKKKYLFNHLVKLSGLEAGRKLGMIPRASIFEIRHFITQYYHTVGHHFDRPFQ